GIGRPSTYATIIGTIIDRGYAQLTGNALVPTFTAFAVTALLEKHFPDLVDTGFTARMEQTLDEISTGEVSWLPYLKDFYLGETGLETQVKERESQIDPSEARTVELENLNAKVRIGRYGPYIETENGDGMVKASIPKDLTPSDLDPEQIETILRQKTEGPDKIGFHPETGEPIYGLIGAYGPYIQLGDASEETPKPKRASLPKGVTLETITLEMAVGLLALPRTLGTHPTTHAKIQANLGRFGPYVVHDQGKEGKDYRSLKAGDDVLTISLERALELLSQPKAGRGASKSKAALRELGAHPTDGEPVNIYDGPYGPYIKHGKVNASLPEGQSIEEITMAIAVEALAAKAPATKSGRKSTKAADKTSQSTTSKTATSKTATTSKTAASGKAATAKKTTARKSQSTSTAAKSTSKKTSKTSTQESSS
ncbi:MAG: topoisomerase C-terminal repeat-containing protein, partial [Leptolyngbyaceae bacterium]|nr:topoisomerase C-terminal repeat-containing protein [Leptolyngbyaceae bacterium]